MSYSEFPKVKQISSLQDFSDPSTWSMILNLPERIDFNNISPHGNLYFLRACQGLVFPRIYFEKLRAMLGVRDIWQYLETPLVVPAGGWVAVTGIQWTKARGADKHPTCRKAPHSLDLPTLSVISTAIEKP